MNDVFSKRSLTVAISRNAQSQERTLIAQGLQEFNAPHLGIHPSGALDVYVRDAEHTLVGGLIGEFAFCCLTIHVLWLEHHLRGKGIGSSILQEAEDAAKSYGCNFATLDTMSFQAPTFYEKRGYTRVGTIEGYPGDAQKILMRKDLRP